MSLSGLEFYLIIVGGVINGDMKLAGGSIYLNSDVK